MTDISTLIGAIKPKDRTDQYLILSALFALGAHASPVTARQIAELLKLHVGARTPVNIPDRLRKYTSYVSPQAKGPPLRWALTLKGLEHLRSSSGLSLPTASDADNFKTDVGIICALEHPELAAVLEALGGIQNWREVGDARHAHVYRESQLQAEGGSKLRLIATTCTSMGLTAAAIATTQLVFQFRPRLVAMIGIAAGTRTGGKEFGDVLVADPSVDYNSGKVVLADGVREFNQIPIRVLA